MIWQDLLCDGWVDAPSVGRCLARVFERDQREVRVVETISLDSNEGGAPVLVQQLERQGPLPMELGIYLHDEALEARVDEPDATLRLVGQICQALHVSCVVGGDERDPSADYLVKPDGSAEETFDFGDIQ